MNEAVNVVVLRDVLAACTMTSVIIGLSYQFIPSMCNMLECLIFNQREITVRISKPCYKEFNKFVREYGYDRDALISRCITDAINMYLDDLKYCEQNN